MAARRFAAAFFAAACFAAFWAAAFLAAAFLAAFFCFGVSFFQAAARSAFFFAAARSAFFLAAARSAYFFAAFFWAARFLFWSAVDPVAADRTETWAVEAADEADAGTLERTTTVPLSATRSAVTQPTSGRPCGRGMSMDSRDRRPRTEGSRTRHEGLHRPGRTPPAAVTLTAEGPGTAEPGPAPRVAVGLGRVRCRGRPNGSTDPSAGQSSAFGTPFFTTTSGEVIVGAVGEVSVLFAATPCVGAGARPPPVGSEKFA